MVACEKDITAIRSACDSLTQAVQSMAAHVSQQKSEPSHEDTPGTSDDNVIDAEFEKK